MRSIKRWLWKDREGTIPDAEAFSRLYQETYLIVFRYTYALSGGPLQEVEDLTAETYARAWSARRTFRGHGPAALGWLLRIARNLVIDRSRQRKVDEIEAEPSVELLADTAQLPEMDLITREQIVILWKLLATLSQDLREMLVLRYILGWQVRQIAAHLGINENTVTVTIKRTLKSLQRNWPEAQEQDHGS